MGGRVEDPEYLEPSIKVSRDADRYDHRAGNDVYTQPGNLFRRMDASRKAPLFVNITKAMQAVPERIQVHRLVHFYKANPDYGKGVAAKLSLDMDQFIGFVDLIMNEFVDRPVKKAFHPFSLDSYQPHPTRPSSKDWGHAENTNLG